MKSACSSRRDAVECRSSHPKAVGTLKKKRVNVRSEEKLMARNVGEE